MANNSSKAAVQAFAQSYCALIVIVLCTLVVITPTHSHSSKQIKTEQLVNETVAADNAHSLKGEAFKQKVDQKSHISEIDYSQLFAPNSSVINQELLTTLITVLSAHDLVAEIRLFVRADDNGDLAYARALTLGSMMAKNSFGPDIARVLIEERYQPKIDSKCLDCEESEITLRFMPEQNPEA